MNRELLALTPAWLALAWLISKVQWIWSHRPEMQFGWIVVLLCGFLISENWPKRPPCVLRPGWVSALLGVFGLGFLVLVQAYQAAFGTNSASLVGHALGTMIVVAANVQFAYGWRGIAVFAFPFGFLLIAMPMPSAVQNLITHNLQAVITVLNVEVLKLIGIPAQRLGSLIQLPTGTVGVNEACSGIRSLQSAMMATLFIGYLTLRSNGLRCMLFAGGAGLAVFGNFIRSFYLSYTASKHGVETVNQVHDAAGWSILVFTAVGVGGLSWVMGKVEGAQGGEQGARSTEHGERRGERGERG
jgi:exosortase